MKEAGFTVLELLIVIALIGIIAAMAIPNLLSARKLANEASAADTLRAISTSEATFLINQNQYGTLAQLQTAGLIDSGITLANTASSAKAGYFYTNGTCDGSEFTIQATRGAVTWGDKDYGITEDGVVRYVTNPTATAGPTGLTRAAIQSGTPLGAVSGS